MENSHREIPQTKLLTLLDVKTIMEDRTVIRKELLGKSCYLIVDQIEAAVPFLDKFKNQIFISDSPPQIIYKKIVLCRSYTLKEVDDKENKNYLRSAFKLEKQRKFEEADFCFRSYLKKVQFRFSLLSKSPIYHSIKSGDLIIGTIDRYQTDKGDFLTVDSGSVRYK